jgi:predicted nicotinamide N-methyase
MERGHPPLCPEIETREARAMLPLWEALESDRGAPQDSPYWAWSWPGSQALARFVLDRPKTVRGRRVLDLGAGNGLAAVAASLAGAREVTANDVEPLACAMAGLTAELNRVEIECGTSDLLDTDPAEDPFDVILVGDLFYSAGLARRAGSWLRRAAGRGSRVLIGEPGRDFALWREVDELARYPVEVRAELESMTRMEVRVMEMR